MIPRRDIPRLLRKAVSQPGYALAAFFKRLRAYLGYSFGGSLGWPETITLFLTYRCNMRCRMCGQWGESGSSVGYDKETLSQSLAAEDIKGLIDDVCGFRPNITLFGGEPLLYPGWDDVTAYAVGKGLRVNMVTNGLLLEASAEKMIASGLAEVVLSIDGPEDVHDKIRGVPGAFRRISRGAKLLAELKKGAGSLSPILNVSCTITEENHGMLADIADIASGFGAAGVTFHHQIFLDSGQYRGSETLFKDRLGLRSTDWKGFVRQGVPNIDARLLLAQKRKCLSRAGGLNVSFYPNYPDDEVIAYYTSFDFVPGSFKARCVSPWMVSYVFPDGSVRPCQAINFDVGNIRESAFRDVWLGEKYMKFRELLKKEKAFSVCSRCTEYHRY